MGASDLRVGLDPILEAFGVPATVVRPAPDNAPIMTRVMWVTPGFTHPANDAFPSDQELRRREPERVLVVPIREVRSVPNDTVITAPEILGDTPRTWRVDGTEYADADHRRVYVVPGNDLDG